MGMGRRAYRENVFKLLFRADYYTAEEMEEQYAYFIKTAINAEGEDIGEDADEDVQEAAADRESAGEAGDVDEEAARAARRARAARASREEAVQRVRDILERLPELDLELNERMEDWSTRRIGRVELTLLRLALYEILYDDEVSTAVAINEAVELTKKYGPGKSPDFVNGVLAKFA